MSPFPPWIPRRCYILFYFSGNVWFNLCLLMEREMNRRGLHDVVEKKKSQGRTKTRRNRQGEPMGKATNFIGKVITRATQRTVRFIRWLPDAL